MCRIKDLFIVEFEMIEKELVGLSYDEGMEFVMDTIMKKENYFSMCPEDRYDYLVDEFCYNYKKAI